jgi:hypothetical protein
MKDITGLIGREPLVEKVVQCPGGSFCFSTLAEVLTRKMS